MSLPNLSAVLLLAALVAGPISAQVTEETGFSYLDGSTLKAGLAMSLPDAWMGFSAAWIRPGNVGFYIDFKASPSGTQQSNYYSNISVNRAEQFFQDRRLADRVDWSVFNIGFAYPLASKLSVYIGGGMASKTFYRSYYDSTEILGRHGVYLISSPDSRESHINGTTGIYVPIGKTFSVQFGYDSAPGSVVAGLSAGFQPMKAVPRR